MSELIHIGGAVDRLSAVLEGFRAGAHRKEAAEAEALEQPPTSLLERLEESAEVDPTQRRRVVVARQLGRCNTACLPCAGGGHGRSTTDEAGRRRFSLCPCGKMNQQLRAVQKMRLPAGAQRLTLENYEMPPELGELLERWFELADAGEAPALILTGPPGTGKTHFMVGAALRCTLSGRRAAYIEAHHYRSLLSNQMDKVEGHEQIDPSAAIKGARALFVDEVGMQRGDLERREICRLLHEAHAAALPVMISSNLTPAELGFFGAGYLTAPVADRLRGACLNGELHYHLGGASRR
jgi:DNA replication protein DnaC